MQYFYVATHGSSHFPFNPELFAKFGLRDADLDTPQTDSAPHFDVNVSSRSRMELCRHRA
jgi:hypothetical protein